MFRFYFVFLIFFISCRDCRDIQVPYYEEEPYEAIDEVDKILEYNVEESTWNRIDGMTLLGVKPILKAKTIVVNKSDYGGEFKVVKTFKSELRGVFTLEDTKYLSSGETIEFNFEQELNDYESVYSIGYDVTPPTIKVKERVTKMRTITKYRTCNSCDENCK